MNRIDSSRVLLTRAEVLHRLKIGTTKLYELVNSGELESVKIGSRRLFPDVGVDRYIEKLRRVDGSGLSIPGSPVTSTGDAA